MARQNINIGAVANDGTGDTLRDAFDKVNDNTIELYEVHGWGYYSDGETTPTTQTFTSTPSKLSIDGLGATTETGYLPLEIRGVSELWDSVNDKIIPISDGDSYDFRLDLTVIGETSNPNEIIIQLDIGGGAAPTIVVVNRYVSTGKATPYNVSVGFPIFTLSTFLANGGQIFMSTDTGNVEVQKRGVYLGRNSSGKI